MINIRSRVDKVMMEKKTNEAMIDIGLALFLHKLLSLLQNVIIREL